MSTNTDKSEYIQLEDYLKVISYSGKNNAQWTKPVEGIFRRQDHETAVGENFVLISEYINGESNGFEIKNISIESPTYADSPLKTGSVFHKFLIF
jgi:hypothetical protein